MRYASRETRRPSSGGETGWGSAARLRFLPAWVVFEREDLLDPLRPAAALVEQHLQRLAHARQARVGAHGGRLLATADAIEDGGQVEQLRAGLQEGDVQG